MFDPTGFMDIKTVFRNVEMVNLTPYTATFAGYKIASGKLSLDLEYKIKQRELLGENQIIMDKLILGEKLEGWAKRSVPNNSLLQVGHACGFAQPTRLGVATKR